MPSAIDITGQRFSLLVAVERVVVDGRSQGWRCSCDCGNETIIPTRERNMLHYTRGLPASGKSTHIRKMVKDRLDQNLLVRINRDDIRAMLGTTTGQYEGFITVLQDAMIDKALSCGHSVAIDDTNFFKGTDKRFRLLAEKHGVSTILHDFTDVPVETCIERDRNREASVGEDVIRGMANRYLGGSK